MIGAVRVQAAKLAPDGRGHLTTWRWRHRRSATVTRPLAPPPLTVTLPWPRSRETPLDLTTQR
jgi:hypothetical protein